MLTFILYDIKLFHVSSCNLRLMFMESFCCIYNVVYRGVAQAGYRQVSTLW